MNKKTIMISVIIIIIIIGIALGVYFSNRDHAENELEQANDLVEESVMENNNITNEIVENENNESLVENNDEENSSTSAEIQTEQESNVENNSEIRIRATVNGQTLYATLENNATTRDFVSKLPITLPMMDLYNREMCYRFDEALATDNLQSSSYEIGEIAYWAPRHSFVILYEQNGERFERQTLGKFDSSVDIFKTTGDVDVTFELAD